MTPARSLRSQVFFWLMVGAMFAINMREGHRRAAEEMRRHNELIGILERIEAKRP